MGLIRQSCYDLAARFGEDMKRLYATGDYNIPELAELLKQRSDADGLLITFDTVRIALHIAMNDDEFANARKTRMAKQKQEWAKKHNPNPKHEEQRGLCGECKLFKKTDKSTHIIDGKYRELTDILGYCNCQECLGEPHSAIDWCKHDKCFTKRSSIQNKR